MTRVTLYYHDETLTGIQSKGHSGYSSKGSDIFCAAISTLMHSLLLGLQDVAQVSGLKVNADERVPVMRLTWPTSVQERVSLLTNTVAESLRHLAAENPKYITLTTEEI